ncbi:MAG: hypothetical protein KC474_00190 [Cyanobacteria bacterium HKST-UBA04]|nr:hypothetical protein [Cyanobacteria bacterium HKST-UBA04]MCA9841799.1 hypothetical protein [Cyanobacteria bacterium HKST-UBA03]
MALNVSTPQLANLFSSVPVNRQTSAIAALTLQDMAKNNLVKAQGARNVSFYGNAFEFQANANVLNDTANLFATLAVRPQLFNRMAGADGFLSFQELNTAASIDGQEGLSSFDLQRISPETYNPNQPVSRYQLETIAYGGPVGGYGSGYSSGFGGVGSVGSFNGGFANSFINPYQGLGQGLSQGFQSVQGQSPYGLMQPPVFSAQINPYQNLAAQPSLGYGGFPPGMTAGFGF